MSEHLDKLNINSRRLSSQQGMDNYNNNKIMFMQWVYIY